MLSIPHPLPLSRGRFIGRDKRFIAEVELAGKRVLAHCVNPGRMEGLVRAGAEAWVSEAQSPKRKLRYTLELMRIDRRIVGVNTALPNRVVEQVIRQRLLKGFKRHTALRREVRYDERSRVDLWLTQAGTQHFIEVKNCHLRYPDQRGYFPDSPSKRAVEHLHALQRMVDEGHRAWVIFVCQRPDVRAIRPSDVHDPRLAEAARKAAKHGVRFRALALRPTATAYHIEREVPVDLKPYPTDQIAKWQRAHAVVSGWQNTNPLA